MKRLLFLVILAAVGWYGWQHRDLFSRRPAGPEVELANGGTRAMQRVRLTVDRETYVRETIEPGARVTFPIRVANASDFRLRWEWRGVEGAFEWRGGSVEPGPGRQRCTIEVFDDNDATVGCVPVADLPGGR